MVALDEHPVETGLVLSHPYPLHVTAKAVESGASVPALNKLAARIEEAKNGFIDLVICINLKLIIFYYY